MLIGLVRLSVSQTQTWTGLDGQLIAKKRSGIVTVSYTSANAESHSGDVLATLPVGYRPSAMMAFVAYNGTQTANGNVCDDGKLRAWGFANDYWRFSVTYPAAN